MKRRSLLQMVTAVIAAPILGRLPAAAAPEIKTSVLPGVAVWDPSAVRLKKYGFKIQVPYDDVMAPFERDIQALSEKLAAALDDIALA